MEKVNYIKGLIDRFHNGELSASEMEFLFLQLEDKNAALKDFTAETWTLSEEKTDSFNPRHEFLLLSEKIGKPANTNEGILISDHHFRRILKWSLSHAAVLAIGLMITWMIMRQPLHEVNHQDQKQMEIAVANGSKTKILLPDQTVVYLNSGSVLKYPADFGKEHRTVSLSGEGYFVVTHDSSRPFLVQTSRVVVKVFGTQFNVKSYPSEATTEATLIQGSVGLYNAGLAYQEIRDSKPLLLLKPNQKATLQGDIAQDFHIHVEALRNADIITDWKDNVLVFSNEQFSSVITKLERWYNVRITLKNGKLSGTKLSGRFNKESIGDVLTALQLIQTFHYTISKNTIEIY